MANKRRENRLNGLFPLSYVGVIPTSPQNFIQDTRAPTSSDSHNFYIGDIWLDFSSDTAAGGYVKPTINNIWILVSLDGGSATWINFGGSGVLVETLTGNDGLAATPLVNNINVKGDGTLINITRSPDVHSLLVSLGGTVAISFPTDSGTAIPSSGSLNIITGLSTNAAGITTLFTGSGNTVQFKNTDANGNVAFGKSSGKSGMSGLRNSAFGQNTLTAITSGSDNTALGFAALNAITTPSDNVAIGSAALLNLVTGSQNIAVGFDSGDNYTGAESSNIIIGNLGVLGENNVIRIGTNGGGAGQQSSCFVAGINGVTVANADQVVLVNVSNQLSAVAHGTTGQVFTSQGAGVNPIWATPAAGNSRSIIGVSNVTLGTTGGVRWADPYSPGATAGQADSEFIVPVACTLSKLYVNVTSNASTTNGTVTLNKNGVHTAVTVTLTALTTGTFTDLVNSVSFVAGDLMQWEMAQTTTGGITGSVSMQVLA